MATNTQIDKQTESFTARNGRSPAWFPQILHRKTFLLTHKKKSRSDATRNKSGGFKIGCCSLCHSEYRLATL
jgi:hypothetical protein